MLLIVLKLPYYASIMLDDLELYYAQNYAGINRQGLLLVYLQKSRFVSPLNTDVFTPHFHGRVMCVNCCSYMWGALVPDNKIPIPTLFLLQKQSLEI